MAHRVFLPPTLLFRKPPAERGSGGLRQANQFVKLAEPADDLPPLIRVVVGDGIRRRVLAARRGGRRRGSRFRLLQLSPLVGVADPLQQHFGAIVDQLKIGHFDRQEVRVAFPLGSRHGRVDEILKARIAELLEGLGERLVGFVKAPHPPLDRAPIDEQIDIDPGGRAGHGILFRRLDNFLDPPGFRQRLLVLPVAEQIHEQRLFDAQVELAVGRGPDQDGAGKENDTGLQTDHRHPRRR